MCVPIGVCMYTYDCIILILPWVGSLRQEQGKYFAFILLVVKAVVTDSIIV
jgi:hypothetical protein